MGIRLERFTRCYRVPQLSVSASLLDLAREALLGRIWVTFGDDQSSLDYAIGDSMAALARRFEDLRFELVPRKLEGDPLSPEEASILDIINDALLKSMPKPTPESERVRVAVDAAKLLFAQRRG
jgi:hypothetical protein